MSLSLRCIKIGMVASIASLFTLVALDNLVDYESNWQFVSHVLSMDTTYLRPGLMNRAITSPFLQRLCYDLITWWELFTAIICWIGCIILLTKLHATNTQFREAKDTAFIGLFFGFLLYMFGFIVIGGQWFCMWQSKTWNGQESASIFVTSILVVMLFLRLNE